MDPCTCAFQVTKLCIQNKLNVLFRRPSPRLAVTVSQLLLWAPSDWSSGRFVSCNFARSCFLPSLFSKFLSSNNPTSRKISNLFLSRQVPSTQDILQWLLTMTTKVTIAHILGDLTEHTGCVWVTLGQQCWSCFWVHPGGHLPGHTQSERHQGGLGLDTGSSSRSTWLKM